MWRCVCECGKIGEWSSNALRSGHTKSCGCWQSETKKWCYRKHGHTTSGGNATPEYQAWKNLRQRCGRANNPQFKNYGARGITVCPQWQNDFACFLADVGPRPSPEHSIHRKNNSLGYFPGNVKWATREEQLNCKRTNFLVEFMGRIQTAAQWARETGLNKQTIIRRIRTCGWTPTRALTTPVT